MKLIIGLGNPGKEYERTRHNAGFLCIDFLQQALSFESFSLDKKMSAEISVSSIDSEKIFLVKPTTFMNHSGTAVQSLIQFYKLSPADIVVIHDDLDIPLGTYKTALSSRSAGHNGVADIIEKLGTQDFLRLRLGIDRPTVPEGACSSISIHDYVLHNFSSEELSRLQETFPRIKTDIFN